MPDSRRRRRGVGLYPQFMFLETKQNPTAAQWRVRTSFSGCRDSSTVQTTFLTLPRPPRCSPSRTARCARDRDTNRPRAQASRQAHQRDPLKITRTHAAANLQRSRGVPLPHGGTHGGAFGRVLVHRLQRRRRHDTFGDQAAPSGSRIGVECSELQVKIGEGRCALRERAT